MHDDDDAVVPEVKGTALPMDDDGHLVIGTSAAEQRAAIQLARLRSTLIVNNHEAIDLFVIRQLALEFATRIGAAYAAIANSPPTAEELGRGDMDDIVRAQVYEHYLVTGEYWPRDEQDSVRT